MTREDYVHHLNSFYPYRGYGDGYYEGGYGDYLYSHERPYFESLYEKWEFEEHIKIKL